MHADCPYKKEKDTWFESRLLKILGIVYGLASPWFVWATIQLFTLNGQIDLIKQRQDSIELMQRDIREIKDSLVDLKIKVGKIEQKVEIK